MATGWITPVPKQPQSAPAKAPKIHTLAKYSNMARGELLAEIKERGELLPGGMYFGGVFFFKNIHSAAHFATTVSVRLCSLLYLIILLLLLIFVRNLE